MRMVYGMRRQLYEPRPPLAPLTSRALISFTAIWVVVNVVVGVTGLGLTEGVATIAWVAHLGGYFTGLLTVGLFDRRPAPRVPVV
jgi:membrane associated rhomboid family serine protease